MNPVWTRQEHDYLNQRQTPKTRIFTYCDHARMWWIKILFTEHRCTQLSFILLCWPWAGSILRGEQGAGKTPLWALADPLLCNSIPNVTCWNARGHRHGQTHIQKDRKRQKDTHLRLQNVKLVIHNYCRQFLFGLHFYLSNLKIWICRFAGESSRAPVVMEGRCSRVSLLTSLLGHRAKKSMTLANCQKRQYQLFLTNPNTC